MEKDSMKPKSVRIWLPAALISKIDSYVSRGYFGSREEAIRYALQLVDEEIGDRAVDMKMLAQLRAERARLRRRENPESG
jgi:Arc/MetJ-type ribon-helix-helix transcriptional regulator